MYELAIHLHSYRRPLVDFSPDDFSVPPDDPWLPLDGGLDGGVYP
jgi:hypothetical protein